MRIVHLLWDSLFPYRCPGCNREVSDGMCSECISRLRPMHDFSCPFCARATVAGRTCPTCRLNNSLAGSTVAMHYETSLREAIHRAKYGPDYRQAAWLAGFIPTPLPRSDLISWVPLHRRRSWFRGFNQSETIACALSVRTGLPCCSTLIRVRQTVSQTGLDRAGRRENVKNAFKAVESQNLANRRILLVDDVLTTGATLEACARALEDAGARSVWAVVLARHR